ncbi:lipopolysaccharide biosynthesis protein [Micromonospora radicis]|uniref:Polysaccharide biosynthesis protein C-terminal domain-containing protein n=1 Tax=Micromonospora radicis TaxID=1894971 RepID=A0A418MX79_9ACTN|nr:polysaccharide biosynthesis C-terminal domain-containing protein [Micromonospora radicis]RIV39636.1 hypothetical protein D2L64_07390 [Micromonospora radicis]
MTVPPPPQALPSAGQVDPAVARRPAARSSLATAGYLVAAQLAVGVASLAINVLAARSMGPAGRGNLALLLQIAYVANLLAIAGTDRSYPATVVAGRGVRGTSLDTLRLVAPAAAVVLLVAGPVVYAIGTDASTGAMLVVAGFTVSACALLGTAALRTGAAASGAVRPYFIATITGQLTLVAAAGALTVTGVSSPDVWLLVYGLALATGCAVAWLTLRRRPDPPDPPHSLAPARRLGLRLLPAAIASLVMLRADRLMLPWLGTYEQLGLYIVVATVAEFAIWPVQSWVDAQSPRWHQRFLAGKLRRTPALLAAVGYGLVAGAVLLLAGHLLVVPVFGAEYRDSVALLVPLAVGTACYSVSRVAIGLGVATGRARGALVADIPAMVVALTAYLVLIPRYGAMGAATGSAVAYGVGAVLALLAQGRGGRPAIDTTADSSGFSRWSRS